MGLGEVCATENAAVVAAAFAYHCAGALDLAEPLYRQVLDRDGDDLNALHMLGALLSKRGQGVESVSLLERAEGQIGSRDKAGRTTWRAVLQSGPRAEKRRPQLGGGGEFSQRTRFDA